MFQYIMACFTEGRTRFGDRQQEVPGHVDPIDHFFDKAILTSNTDIPKDRYGVFLFLRERKNTNSISKNFLS